MLTQHLAQVHAMNLTLYPCTKTLPDGTQCDYEAKSNGNLTRHLANSHGINLTLFPCTETVSDGTLCEYKGKANCDT